MKYFGVSSCPYCKKRVNLLRTWSLKRQGEYQCPRCGGISNIFLSPLIYVFALLAIFSGGAVYFFHKFILDDISLNTLGQVLLPFAVFFLLSLFMVNLEKPVIKKMSRAEIEKKKRKSGSMEDRRMPATNTAGQTGRVFYDSEEYLPKTEYRTGPLPQMSEGENRGIPSHSVAREELEKTSVVEMPKIRQAPAQRAAAPQREAVSRQVPQRPVSQRSLAPQRTQSAAAVQRPIQRAASEAPSATARQVVYPNGHTAQRTPAGGGQTPSRPVAGTQAAARPAVDTHTVSHVDIPSVGDDFFAKYDDPAYVERRLKEIQRGRDE